MTGDELRQRAVIMETLDLETAAAFMWTSTSTMRKRAAKGEVPGAFKAGRTWVFIKQDLLAWMRTGSEQEMEDESCQSSSGAAIGTSISRSKARKQYENLLGLQPQHRIKPSLKPITTN